MSNRLTIAEQNANRKQDIKSGIWMTVITVFVVGTTFALMIKQLG